MQISKPHKTVIIKRTVLVVFCIALGWFLKSKMSPQIGLGGFGAQTPYVLVNQVQLEDTSKASKHIAHVESINGVTLQPEVSGTIEEVLFKEGAFVKEGDILFKIDPSTYLATLNLRKAELEQANARLTEAERNYERQIKLSKQNIASKATFDSAESSYLQAKATVEQAKASLELAKINYDYTFVRAPISGFIGKALVTKGNRVAALQQVLAKIVQVDPIRIAFTLTDKEFIAFKNSTKEKNASDIQARITLPDGTVETKEFKSSFIDNEVSTNTATIALYGDFENGNETLIPGTYVQIELINKPDMKVVISQAALAQDEHGFYAFVVGDDDIAEERRLVLGDVMGDRQVVEKGINAGDKVVIQGVQKLTNGTKVKAGLVSENNKL